jgi:hypothetical protein
MKLPKTRIIKSNGAVLFLLVIIFFIAGCQTFPKFIIAEIPVTLPFKYYRTAAIKVSGPLYSVYKPTLAEKQGVRNSFLMKLKSAKIFTDVFDYGGAKKANLNIFVYIEEFGIADVSFIPLNTLSMIDSIESSGTFAKVIFTVEFYDAYSNQLICKLKCDLQEKLPYYDDQKAAYILAHLDAIDHAMDNIVEYITLNTDKLI